jgi:isopentenyl-diphosphate delta-isomerase
MANAPETGFELVVLLDADGTPIGTADKSVVHGSETPLHLAFSCHIVGGDGRFLVTRRALSKLAFPGVWTNAVCGHPAPSEAIEAAVHRRARFELGLELGELELVLPDFRYRAADASGTVENEICPVYLARIGVDPMPDPREVVEWAWVEQDALRVAVRSTPFAFSPWLVGQLDAWPSTEG